MSKKDEDPATPFVSFAQVQSMDGYRVEFQPEHLLCEDCWSLAFTSYVEAKVFGGGISQVKFQRGADDPCGMTVSLKKEAA